MAAKWARDVAKLREGTKLYLTNDFAAAERLFAAMEREPGVRLPAAERYRQRAEAARGGVAIEPRLFDECFPGQSAPGRAHV